MLIRNQYTVLFGDPKENRTPDSALRGQRLDRLTIGPFVSAQMIISLLILICKYKMTMLLIVYGVRMNR